jgi:hypothetical protein
VDAAFLWSRRGVPQPRLRRGPSLRSGPSDAPRLCRRDRRSAPAAHPPFRRRFAAVWKRGGNPWNVGPRARSGAWRRPRGSPMSRFSSGWKVRWRACLSGGARSSSRSGCTARATRSLPCRQVLRFGKSSGRLLQRCCNSMMPYVAGDPSPGGADCFAGSSAGNTAESRSLAGHGRRGCANRAGGVRMGKMGSDQRCASGTAPSY